jgi:hypothetical protein
VSVKYACSEVLRSDNERTNTLLLREAAGSRSMVAPSYNAYEKSHSVADSDHSVLWHALYRVCVACRVDDWQVYIKVKVKLSSYRHADAKGRGTSSSFLASALDGGEWSASRLGRALAPGKGPPVPIE